YIFFFFFSSRRRHTRSKRDWSSDVCSSDLIDELGDDLPTAFCISSDVMAIGSMRALHEEGIAIPNRVSIFGINDISVSRHLYPPLSTIRVFTENMGETAVDTLLERLEGREIAKKIVISTELVIRESTKGL